MGSAMSSKFLTALCLAFGLVWAGCTPAESKDNPEAESVPAGGTAAPSVAEVAPEAEPSTREPTSAGDRGSQPPAAAPVEPEPEPEPVPPAPRLFAPAGAHMTFRLGSSVSTKSSEVGDRFQATLIQDVTSSEGERLVPLGSIAHGVVVESQESRGSDDPAVLALRLELLEVHGNAQPFEATIVEAEGSSDTRDSDGTTAVKIAAGTAAGALLGRVIGGNTEGTLVGAGAGAVAGTVYAVKTKDGHAEMAEGSILTVRLDEPLPVR